MHIGPIAVIFSVALMGCSDRSQEVDTDSPSYRSGYTDGWNASIAERNSVDSIKMLSYPSPGDDLTFEEARMKFRRNVQARYDSLKNHTPR